MYIFGYLRASTNEQDAERAKGALSQFVEQKGMRVAAWYVEQESGASLQRPKLLQLLNDAQKGDLIIIEQIDRLSRLNEASWSKLKEMLYKKELKVISLDLPTSHIALAPEISDEFTNSMIKAINNMMMDMLATISRKDYEDRRHRQKKGIEKAMNEGKYKGRKPDQELHEKIYKLRVDNQMSINETAKMIGVSAQTVVHVVKKMKAEREG